MTNLSSTISDLLVQKHTSSALLPESRNLNQKLDSFLKEAYQINKSISSLLSYLRSVRQPYLSSAPASRRNQQHAQSSSSNLRDIPAHLDDKQRDTIDTQTSQILREINGNITNLSSAVSLQHDTASKVLEKKYGKPSGFLWRWAAGDGDVPDAGKPQQQLDEEGQVTTLKVFRDSVLWYLSKGLEGAVKTQQEMVEIRLERERQKQMSVLYDKRNSGIRVNHETEAVINGNTYGNIDLRGHDTYNPALDSSDAGGQELSAEQMSLFEEENRGIFEHYNDQLTKVTQAEKSLMEISSLQQTLVGHLSVQGEMIGQLVEDASSTDENVRRGNKELKKASERSSTAKAVFWSTAGLCSFLVVWDLIF